MFSDFQHRKHNIILSKKCRSHIRHTHCMCAKEAEKRHRMRCDCSFIWTLSTNFSTISYAYSLSHSLSCVQKRHSLWQIFLSTVNEIIWSKSEILLYILFFSRVALFFRKSQCLKCSWNTVCVCYCKTDPNFLYFYYKRFRHQDEKKW